MIVHRLVEAAPPELAEALSRFEEQFVYPLGPDRTFHISHGTDYPRFFRAIGDASCFVAERAGRVVGVIGAALCDLREPDGRERRVLYLGDLKVDPTARGGATLLRLAAAVAGWVDRRADAAFGVVMDGTPVVPTRYTGRLGIPLFGELGKITVLRLPTYNVSAVEADDVHEIDDTVGTACFARLIAGRYTSLGGSPAERSEIDPIWLIADAGRACGRLEDTRRAKRLIASGIITDKGVTGDGVDMRSAHLSRFAYQEPAAGVRLLKAALRRAAGLGFPSLFTAIPAAETEAFCQALGTADIVVAPATVYGTGLDAGAHWNINTAEI